VQFWASAHNSAPGDESLEQQAHLPFSNWRAISMAVVKYIEPPGRQHINQAAIKARLRS
jgi:hypothetical protein